MQIANGKVTARSFHWALIAILAFGSWQALARDVVAKKDGVQVYEQPDKKSKVVVTLKNGDALPAVDRMGMYWQVDHKSQKAYVFLTDVSVRNAAETQGLSNALRHAVQQNREEAQASDMRTRSAVMGVRGLDQSDAEFAGNAKPNLRMVYQMENYNVSSTRIKQIQSKVDGEINQRLAQ